MFDNIGGKIKTLAKIICWLGIIISVISGMVLIGISGLVSVLTIIAGSLTSWIGSFSLYGFGELIEKTTEIAENTRYINIDIGSKKTNAKSILVSDGSGQEASGENAVRVTPIYERYPLMFKFQEIKCLEHEGSGRCQICFKRDDLTRYEIKSSVDVRTIPICQTCVSHMTKEEEK
jgi:hypothetical protein